MIQGDIVGIAAGVLILLVMGLFFSRVFKVNVPRLRAPYFLVMLLAAGLGLLTFFLDSSWIGKVPAAFALLLGTILPALRLQSIQNAQAPAVATGDSIINFIAADDSGQPFDLAHLAGTPFLLKFFRGHW